jgi:hypothetical protein
MTIATPHAKCTGNRCPPIGAPEALVATSGALVDK